MATPAKPKAPALKPVALKLDVGDIDLSKAVPMTAGDLAALEGQGVIIGGEDSNVSRPKNTLKFLLWFAQKVNEAVTYEMLLNIPVWQMSGAVEYILKASEKPTDPNS